MATSLADAVPINVPGEYTQLIGPFGALVGLVIALKWMTGRLNKSEDKYEARQLVIEKRDELRQEERDTMLKTLIALSTETKDVIWQNNHIIEDFSKAIKFCPGQSKQPPQSQ